MHAQRRRSSSSPLQRQPPHPVCLLTGAPPSPSIAHLSMSTTPPCEGDCLLVGLLWPPPSYLQQPNLPILPTVLLLIYTLFCTPTLRAHTRRGVQHSLAHSLWESEDGGMRGEEAKES